MLKAFVSQHFHSIVGGLVSKFRFFVLKKPLNFFFSSCLKAFTCHDCKKLSSWQASQKSKLLFPRKLVSFVRPRELVSFDPWHMTCSPPIGKRVWVGRYNKLIYQPIRRFNHMGQFTSYKLLADFLTQGENRPSSKKSVAVVWIRPFFIQSLISFVKLGQIDKCLLAIKQAQYNRKLKDFWLTLRWDQQHKIIRDRRSLENPWHILAEPN